ncbi:MAG: hypothetical protein AB8H03_18065 [Saprospiraceae bacterium]
MFNKVIYIFLFLSLFTVKSYSQSKEDLKECIVKIFELEEINSLLFSLEKSNGDSILCIEGRPYKITGDTINLKTEDFEVYNKHSIYVESSAFIEAFDIQYWLSIDSINIKKNLITFEFKTTKNHFKNNDYTYFVGKVSFIKRNQIWQIKEKNIQLDKYIPPYIINSDYVDEVRERNKKYIEEVKRKRAKKEKN